MILSKLLFISYAWKSKDTFFVWRYPKRTIKKIIVKFKKTIVMSFKIRLLNLTGKSSSNETSEKLRIVVKYATTPKKSKLRIACKEKSRNKTHKNKAERSMRLRLTKKLYSEIRMSNLYWKYCSVKRVSKEIGFWSSWIWLKKSADVPAIWKMIIKGYIAPLMNWGLTRQANPVAKKAIESLLNSWSLKRPTSFHCQGNLT